MRRTVVRKTQYRWLAVAGLALAALAAVATAQAPAVGPVMVRPSDIKLVAMPNGTRQADVVGDIKKPGTYAVRTILPAGLRIPPHCHPESRIVLVMSGTLYVGFGDKYDEAALTPLPPGSVFTEPAATYHFTWAKDGEVVLHVTGQGPTGTTWADAKR